VSTPTVTIYRLSPSGAAIAAAYDRETRRLQRKQKRTLQRCLDAIIWEWDNPYVDPSDWTPLEDEE
jgi:hypothetical protein